MPHMDDGRRIAFYTNVYSRLLWLLPADQRDRFREEMEQLFEDRLRDCANDRRPLWRQALWMYGDTVKDASRENSRRTYRKHAPVLRVGAITLAALTLPLVGTQLSDEVHWTPFDFIVGGTMFFTTGLAFSFLAKRCGSLSQKSAVGLALAATLLHVWVNGSVGMVGSETDGFNALYYLVPLVGIIGGTAARLRARMMAWVLLGMAAVQAGLGLLALAVDRPEAGGDSVLEVVGVTGLFMGLFFASAWMFARVPDGSSSIT